MSKSTNTPVPSRRRKIAGCPLTLVDLSTLRNDPSYQRNPVARHIKSIADAFDERVLTAPIVVERADKTLWLIDGQQRVAALESLGYTHVYAMVITVKTTPEEAQLFVKVNKGSKSLTAQEIYKACLAYETNVATAIEELLNRYGMTGTMSDPRKEVKAIAKMLEAWGPRVPIYQDYDLSTKDNRDEFNHGLRVLEWAIKVGLPLIREGNKASHVYNGYVLGALIWLKREHKHTDLIKVRRVLSKAESLNDLKVAITQISGSAGGSRRDTYGVRLAYWLNTQADTPFIALRKDEWALLDMPHVNLGTDPAILVKPDDFGQHHGPTIGNPADSGQPLAA